MQFLVNSYDGPNMLDKRMEVRFRHLEGMKTLGEQAICAGGLLDDEGKMKGSALGAIPAVRDPLMAKRRKIQSDRFYDRARQNDQ